jgi:hypothetical protein
MAAKSLFCVKKMANRMVFNFLLLSYYVNVIHPLIRSVSMLSESVALQETNQNLPVVAQRLLSCFLVEPGSLSGRDLFQLAILAQEYSVTVSVIRLDAVNGQPKRDLHDQPMITITKALSDKVACLHAPWQGDRLARTKDAIDDYVVRIKFLIELCHIVGLIRGGLISPYHNQRAYNILILKIKEMHDHSPELARRLHHDLLDHVTPTNDSTYTDEVRSRIQERRVAMYQGSNPRQEIACLSVVMQFLLQLSDSGMILSPFAGRNDQIKSVLDYFVAGFTGNNKPNARTSSAQAELVPFFSQISLFLNASNCRALRLMPETTAQVAPTYYEANHLSWSARVVAFARDFPFFPLAKYMESFFSSTIADLVLRLFECSLNWKDSLATESFVIELIDMLYQRRDKFTSSSIISSVVDKQFWTMLLVILKRQPKAVFQLLAQRENNPHCPIPRPVQLAVEEAIVRAASQLKRTGSPKTIVAILKQGSWIAFKHWSSHQKSFHFNSEQMNAFYCGLQKRTKSARKISLDDYRIWQNLLDHCQSVREHDVAMLYGDMRGKILKTMGPSGFSYLETCLFTHAVPQFKNEQLRALYNASKERHREDAAQNKAEFKPAGSVAVANTRSSKEGEAPPLAASAILSVNHDKQPASPSQQNGAKWSSCRIM